MYNNNIYFYDFYLNIYEYRNYLKYDYSKYKKKIPEWLNIRSQPKKSLEEIDNFCLDAYAFNGLDYSLN